MTSFLTTRSGTQPRATLAGTGNRLALAGVVLYFCEWVGIVGAGGINVLFAPGTSPAKVLDGYAGQSNAFAWAAGWFSVVLLGRVLFAVGVRQGLRASGHDGPLAEFGVLAMLGGVVFEIMAYALVMAAALLAGHGGRAETITALDASGFSVESMLYGTTGAAVVALAWAMHRAGVFPRVLCIVGLVGGVSLVLAGLAFNAPALASTHDVLLAGVPLLWIWMWWTGALVWRRAPSRSRTGA
jgi:hypothetical protein